MADKTRYQVGRNVGTGPIDEMTAKPVTSPVDSYVRPTANTVQLEGADNTLGELADALNKARPGVDALGDKLIEADNEKQTKAGQEARIRNQANFRDAVKQGLIPEAANPWFVKGYMQLDGRASGQQMDAEMRQAWANSAVKESDDPKEFQSFVSGFVKDWTEKNGKGMTPDWMDGFKSEMSKSENNLYAQHIAHRQAEISAGMRDKAGQVVSNLLAAQKEREMGMAPDDPLVQASRQALSNEISAIGADLKAKGLSGTDFNKTLAETVIARGQELGTDPFYARSILSGVKTPGGSVAQIADVARNLTAGERSIREQMWSDLSHSWQIEARPYELQSRQFHIESMAHSRDQWEKQKKDQRIEEQAKGYANELTTEIFASGRLDQVKLLKLAGIDYQKASAIQQIYHSKLVQSQEIVVDQQVYSGMATKIAMDPHSFSAEQIYAMVRPGGIDRQAADTLWSRAMTLQRETPEERDPFFKTEAQGLLTSVSLDPTGKTTGEAANKASVAVNALRDYWNRLSKDPNLSIAEKHMKLADTRQKLYMIANKVGGQEASDALPTVEQQKASRMFYDKGSNSVQTIPEESIQRLMGAPNDPTSIKYFDEAYGPDAANRIFDSMGLKGANRPKPMRLGPSKPPTDFLGNQMPFDSSVK